ncbi:hypothetical protein QBC41DRAFT_254444 [Cercophora samala]|uniref:CFEM domain-containing protein n=1 Tax=Cercophora samala TaxID=330535 RepID=A0AA39ZAL8_9PEZI|nr:hypothetical protein QBC41DRAFT_254444 [Cercophora samala]
MMYTITAIILSLLSPAVADVPVAISTFPLFLEQRDCVKLCLWQTATSATGGLVAAIGCSKPWVNECFCQRELASKASSFISTCVASRCGSPKDNAPSNGAVSRGLDVYNTYCQENGLPIPTVASIKSFDGYLAMPECARLCLWHAGQTEDDLMPNMGCGEPWDNGCLCDKGNNEERVTRGKDFVTGCIASRCGTRGAQDGIVTEALGVWVDYCGSAGSFLTAITGVVLTSESLTTTGTTEGPSQADGLGGGYETAQISTGAIIGIVVGGVATATAIVIAAVMIMYRKRQNKLTTDKNQQAENTPPSENDINQPTATKAIHEKQAEPEVAEADQNNGVGTRHELHASNRDAHQYSTELPA